MEYTKNNRFEFEGTSFEAAMLLNIDVHANLWYITPT